MKNCSNQRCTMLHADEYRGQCDGCGAPVGDGRVDRIQMTPDQHLNQMRAQAAAEPSSVAAPLNRQQPEYLMEVAKEEAIPFVNWFLYGK